MSSRCHRSSIRAVAAMLAALAPSAMPATAQQNSLPAEQSGPATVAVTGLFPGDGSPPPEDPMAKHYEGNPHAIDDGKRLFSWYNCDGCHFHGGGGIGPPLMTGHWRYGGQLDQIFESIAQGRPNGMPSWQGKLPAAQIWELAAYVKSMSAPTATNGPGQPVPQTAAPPLAPAPPPTSVTPATQSTPPP